MSQTLIEYQKIVKRYDKLLTKEEEKNLLMQVQNGSKSALNKLYNYNLKLVIKYTIEKQKKYNNLDLDDMLQEASSGLIEAIKKFDFNKDTRLSTYATYWIEEKLNEYIVLGTDKTLPLSKNVKQDLRKIWEVKEKFLSENGRKPTFKEIKSLLNNEFSEEKIKELIQFSDLNKRVISISQNINEDSDETFESIIENKDNETIQESIDSAILAKKCLKIIKETLGDSKEYQVFAHRRGLIDDKKTYEEIGNLFGISKQASKQIDKKAVDKVNKAFAKAGIQQKIDD